MSKSAKDTPQPNRGRKLEFEPEEVLHNAMLVFWRKGYAATTYADLVRETGVHRYGLYKVLGNKDQAFIRVLEHYVTDEVANFTSPMREPDAGLADIYNYFNAIMEFNNENPLGCMVCNVVVSDTSDNDSIAVLTKAMLTMVRDSLAHSLTNAVTKGELRKEIKVNELAITLLGAMVGASTLYRSPLGKEAGTTFITRHLEMLDN